MAPKLQRREFLTRGASALPVLAHAGFAQARSPEPENEATRLVADPQHVLDLPSGFSYRILSRSGDPMSDGYRTPGNPDGMGIFRGAPGELVLMRNHEIMPGDFSGGPYAQGQAIAKEAYDPDGFGGVTRVVLDEHTCEVRSSNLVLTGTHWNCAGGLSPWGWLSCEELFAPNHGYVFLCPSDANTVQPARPIKAYGRFRHEAATTDPDSLIAFLTEDIADAAFYRFVPHDRAAPFDGTLQALAVKGNPRFDTAGMALHDRMPIHWVDVPNPDPDEDTVRLQAHEAGAAIFRRNEGLWLHGDELFLCATAGGPIGRGQIFRVRHRPEADAHLELIAHTTDPEVLDMPDNLTVSPHGQLYAAEDGLDGNFLRRITMAGRVVDFARNALSTSEFAGPCFAPDGKTMFVNIQHNGLTLAITGPFEEFGKHAAPASAATNPTHAWSDGLAGIAGGLAILALAALRRRKTLVSAA